jgi:hypothetical protein
MARRQLRLVVLDTDYGLRFICADCKETIRLEMDQKGEEVARFVFTCPRCCRSAEAATSESP